MPLNTENFNQLIIQLESTNYHPIRSLEDGFSTNFFNLATWQFQCGAPACLAGHGALLFGDAQVQKDMHYPTNEFGRGLVESTRMKRITAEALGIDYWWACDKLFNPEEGVNLRTVRPSEAISALRVILAAGDQYINLTCYDIWADYRNGAEVDRTKERDALVLEAKDHSNA